MRRTLEYAMLAGLAHEPRSAYDLTKWLAQVASHFWPVGHSGIYPALARLEDEGLARHTPTPSDRGPERKVYALTAHGRDELLAWVDGPLAPAQVRDEQLVRALCYGFPPPARALDRLERVRRHHAERLAHFEGLERQLQRGRDATGEPDGIAGPARIGTLLVLRCGILGEQASVRWCDEAAALLRGARQDGETGEFP